MGFLDSLFLSFFGLTLLFSLILLVISLIFTDNEDEKSYYMKQYMPFITISVAMIIFWFGIFIIFNVWINRFISVSIGIKEKWGGHQLSKLSKEEREELILICSLMTQYSEDYLQKLSDQELIEIYNNSMNASLKAGM